MQILKPHIAPTESHLRLYLSLLLLLFCSGGGCALSAPPASPLPSDAVSLLSFKANADLDNRLLFALNERFDYCQWQGVKCGQGRVVRLALPNYGLRGAFPADSLARLDQLRVINLRNNSLSGPIPDLSRLPNLRSLLLSLNSLSGPFPSSILSLNRVQSLDLSHNNLTGPIPPGLVSLDGLVSLRLENNRFSGRIPPLNQSFLRVFNVSGNNLTGDVPVTPALSRFSPSSFSQNPNLCGEIVNKPCPSRPPFFGSSRPPPSQSQGILLSPPAPSSENRSRKRKTPLILGFVFASSVLILSLLVFLAFAKRRSRRRRDYSPKKGVSDSDIDEAEAPRTEDNVLEGEREGIRGGIRGRRREGNLVFCEGEREAFTQEQLMKASAEMLGRGTLGATYKAAMGHRLTVSVKRLDGDRTAGTSAEAFERHMAAVGALRHPNLVPLRAYFQAKEERLVVYDYQPNGSLLSLIHGSRSTRARPLHWTSCLKIAEDVAQGLSYIHQASTLIHGNLKSSNVLLGPDFEACLTDYCLATLTDSSSSGVDPNTVRYRAPEARKSTRQATPKSDVYAFGVLLLEILTGKPPSQHPFLEPTDMPNWVRAVREDESEDDRLGLLVEVASVCSQGSPEQRPTMRRVLKMIREIKESLMVENDNASFGYP